MRNLRVPLACWMLSVPASLVGQTSIKAASCVDADSALGPLAKDQSRATLTRFESAGNVSVSTSGPGRHYRASVSVVWRAQTIIEPVAPQLVVSLPTKTVTSLSSTGASIVLLVDSWLSLPLGPPTLPRVENNSPFPIETVPVSALLTEEDLRSLAGAKTAVITYGDKRVEFEKADMAALNALYRLVRCTRAAARGAN